jgi:hypothetical protein
MREQQKKVCINEIMGIFFNAQLKRLIVREFCGIGPNPIAFWNSDLKFVRHGIPERGEMAGNQSPRTSNLSCAIDRRPREKRSQ